ncbi:chemotaxis protein CheW [Aestuariivirga litoralis]|uniref:chemotaxis protein CheW n=1 Tax=Aestuariivirga litoralis TaxID=2650924 RepID=UPI0018C60730|nr:chemotaxis protein CheW [Aestuariivirga litoralis]MBG1233216.1 chemotaxis protein CheW [Aestuariivirga litoralis]
MTKDQTIPARELIVFMVGEMEFCVDIIQVREIRGWTPATPVPHSPPFVIGVINLRGTVLPVIDLPARLAKGKSEPSARHAVIVVQDQDRMTGLLVDMVSDIISVDAALIHPTPDVSSAVARSFVSGIVTLEGRMISLLSLQDVLPSHERKAA